VKICVFLVGIVEFLGIKTVITPPAVSIPFDNGVTSSNNKSRTWLEVSPDKIAPWTAAPYATASSGLMALQGSFPLKNSWMS